MTETTIIEYLRIYGPSTSAEIAEVLGVTRKEVSQVLTYARKMGRVETDGKAEEGTNGRRADLWRAN